MLAIDDQRPVYTVSELTAEARFLLEEQFPLVWVEGEISNLRVPSSGHWYFTLKDDRAQVRCAMFVNRNRSVQKRPSDGDQVMVRGRVSLYEARGDFQLIAEHLEPAGEGALRAAFDALKRKLVSEGLTDAARKRPLPAYPNHIAVISSASGAALRDVLAVFKRRWPPVAITLLPVAVQGNAAQGEILAAFETLAAWPAGFDRPHPELVLVTRGGGSLEDLWAFNLEPVARAIASCPLPVVTGIGHETDFTIADFVADLRAPTPSAAAELTTPSREEWLETSRQLTRSLAAHVRADLAGAQAKLGQLSHRLVHPGRTLQQRMQRIDELEQRLAGAVSRRIERHHGNVQLFEARLTAQHPRERIKALTSKLRDLRTSLDRTVLDATSRRQADLATVTRTLHAVSPTATLERGYAIITTPPSGDARFGRLVASVSDASVGDPLVAHLRDGRLGVDVRRRDED
jgi:exodeoxyribonuclease VII large subunit